VTQNLLKVYLRRTNSAPASERDKKKQAYKRHIFAHTASARRSISPNFAR